MSAAPDAGVAPAMGRDAPADLRVRLLSLVLLATAGASLTRLPVAGLALAAAAGFGLWLARPSGWRPLLHRLGHVEGFLLVLLILLPFTTPGQPLALLPGASREGLALGLLVAAKVNAVAFLLFGLLGGVAPERLGGSLRALGCPARFVELLELLLRHSHTARDGFRRQGEAMRARGFRPGTSLHCWRSYGHLLGGALLRAFDRAERVSEAMRLRGGGRIAHAVLPPLLPGQWGLVGLAGAAAGGLLLLDRLG